MKKKILSAVLALAMLICMIPMSVLNVGAGISGDFEVTLTPEGVTIDSYWGNSENVVIPDTIRGMPVVTIATDAFYCIETLTSVKIPDTVKTIENYAFGECSSLSSVNMPAALTSIGDYAFSFTALTNVSIPAGVVFIGENAFMGSTAINSINVDAANTVYSSQNGVLYNKDKTKLVIYPGAKSDREFIIPSTVTLIPDGAFSRNESLESVTIPASVVDFGASAFSGCRALSSVTLCEGLKSIGIAAFEECAKLTAITLPQSLRKIDAYSFFGTGIDSVVIPAGVTSIGDCAFSNTSLTSVTIPASVKEIGSYAFDTKTLESISVKDGNTEYESVDGVLYNIADKELIRYPAAHPGTSYTVKDGTIAIGQASFGGSPVTTVNLPETLKKIDMSAFFACSSLTAIELPQSLESIGALAFVNCEALESVTSTGVSAFVDTMAFHGTSFFDNAQNRDTDGALYVGNCLVSVQNQELTVLNVRDGTQYISPLACENCNSIVTINLPAGIRRIGANAFVDTAFYQNDSNFDEYDCLYIGNILISSNYYTELDAVVIKDGTKMIADNALRYCGYNSIEIPDSVTTIGSNALEGNNITTINVPSGITEIFEYAFSSCDTLETITLPAGITKIAANAFKFDEMLKVVYFGGSEADWDEIEIENNGNDYLLAATIDCAVKCVHSFGAYTSDNNATCTIDGTKSAYCSKCGVKDTVADEGSANGHKWGVEQITVAPTKAHAGTVTKTCKVCGTVVEEEAKFLYGDIYQDRQINAKDDIFMCFYLSGDLSSIDFDTANINNDDRLDGKDGNLLRQMVIGDYNPNV